MNVLAITNSGGNSTYLFPFFIFVFILKFIVKLPFSSSKPTMMHLLTQHKNIKTRKVKSSYKKWHYVKRYNKFSTWEFKLNDQMKSKSFNCYWMKEYAPPCRGALRQGVGCGIHQFLLKLSVVYWLTGKELEKLPYNSIFWTSSVSHLHSYFSQSWDICYELKFTYFDLNTLNSKHLIQYGHLPLYMMQTKYAVVLFIWIFMWYKSYHCLLVILENSAACGWSSFQWRNRRRLGLGQLVYKIRPQFSWMQKGPLLRHCFCCCASPVAPPLPTLKSFGAPLLLKRTLKKRRDIATMVLSVSQKFWQMWISCWADSPIKDVDSNQILLVE